ncbi:MAG: hypothetical protein NWE93_05380 [Candidatus Bathyarchaeota archaeon]|nr:hypothetical protein [Candidatus Bathyarchaeota archaeon]
MRILQAQGSYKPNPPKLLSLFLVFALIGSLLIILALSAFAFEELHAYLFVFNFFTPIIIAEIFVPATYAYLWQRRNKRILYLSGELLYPYPYINIAAGKETIY